ncbi:MAG TPA: radical SAM protein, partial [Candidatus Limnocylindria bacterium]|nr:radical SAM protein [Candidatus Limnocylindria bacterium]
MRVYLKTLGCRLNQAEIDRMARQLILLGHEVVDSPADAESVIVNTCAVTQEANRSSRQAVYQLGRENPAAAITVTGCYAHLEPGEAAALPGVVNVVDNLHKEALVPDLTGAPPGTLATLERFDQEPMVRDAQPGVGGRTRAFVKVQDGCDRHCTFCVTRIARGPGRSRPLADIVAEVQALGAAGYQEAVLTGVHLGSYGWDRGEADGLMQLIRALLVDTDMPRLRL